MIASASISCTRKGVPDLEPLIFGAETNPINVLHKIGEEIKTTTQIQNQEHLQYKTEISKRRMYSGTKILRRLTAGGTSATVAITNHMTPSRMSSTSVGNITANENCKCPTCFQRRRKS